MFFNKLFNPSVRKIDQLLSAYSRLGRFSGAVLVARGAQILHKGGYGMASYEHAAPNTPQTLLQLGSLSKAFTGLAILQLQEKGRLTVQDPVARYLPDYPNGELITIHHLLTNTAGIPDYVTTEDFAKTMALPITLDALVATFRDRPLLFAPSERFSYSNSGWVLLGAIIERIADQPYGDYLREQIFAPLQMAHSGYAANGQVLKAYAAGYLCQDGQVITAAFVHPTQMHAAGGLYSTAEDLWCWIRGLRNKSILSAAGYDALFTPYVDSGYGQYGYGWVVDRVNGRRNWRGEGGTPGFVCTVSTYPDDDVVIIVLSNFENGAFAAIERGLAAIVFGEPYVLPNARTFITADPASFAPLLGNYESYFVGRPVRMKVWREDDKLMVVAAGLPPTQLHAMSSTRYFAQMKGEVELEFMTDGTQPAQEIALNWAGNALKAKRVAA